MFEIVKDWFQLGLLAADEPWIIGLIFLLSAVDLPCTQEEDKNKTFDTDLNPSQLDNNNDAVTDIDAANNSSVLSQETTGDRDTVADLTKDEAQFGEDELSTIYKVRRHKKVASIRISKSKRPAGHKMQIMPQLNTFQQSNDDREENVQPRYY